MDHINHIIGNRAFDRVKIQRTLDESLFERDFYSKKSRNRLIKMGLNRNEALMLLAQHKSKCKYGYELPYNHLSHLLNLAEDQKRDSVFKNLIESPFLLVKACWIFDHAPYFLYYDQQRPEERDGIILEFARQYNNLFLKKRTSIDKWHKITSPKRLLSVNFWEKQIIDPVGLIEKIRRKNIEGLELSTDFHPFNYTKLLPEEFSDKKREQIREACRRSGLKIDIHSPIVGPYAPSPDPKKGKQLFYDPLKNDRLIGETIDLARDIGAGSVVIHLIDPLNLDKMIDLIMKAAESNVRITLENYCQMGNSQNSETFIQCLDEITGALPKEVMEAHFGITLDVGHLNIEGEDPLVSSNRIGRWCLDKKVFIRVHATDNYGKLLFSPPAYSADVHGSMTGRGINNTMIIKLLRSMGHQFDVVAEQIQPLSDEDIAIIHKAQSAPLSGRYEEFIQKGRSMLSRLGAEGLITPEIINEKAYLFLAGLAGLFSLKEHLVFRKIQDQKYLSVDEAKKISQDFMKMPQKFRSDLMEYVDDLLLPIQGERGLIQKSEVDLICQNISGALFGTINNEHLNEIFSKNKNYQKGDVICRQGTQGQEMYFIKEGEVAVFINGTPMATLNPGEIFGEISLFYNIKRTATIKATTHHTKLGILTRPGFESLLQGGQPYTLDLIYRLYNILPERLRNLNEKYKTAINALHLIVDGDKKRREGKAKVALEFTPKRDLFTKFTREEAKKVFQEQKEFDADQIIFAEGDRGNGAYFLLKGTVKAVTFSRSNEEILLGELGRGDIFGEMALIDNRPRSASIITKGACKVAYIEKKPFNQFLEERTDLGFRLMAIICLSLFRRILTLDRIYAELKEVLS